MPWAWWVTQAALPLLRLSDIRWSRTSRAGSGRSPTHTDPDIPQSQFHGAYLVHAGTEGRDRHADVAVLHAVPEGKFDAVEPGFTATDLTGNAAGAQSADRAAEVVVRWATIGNDGPTGAFQGPAGAWPW